MFNARYRVWDYLLIYNDDDDDEDAKDKVYVVFNMTQPMFSV